MQALETIARQNAAATERDIPNQQAAGKHVVAQYAGLNFIGYQAFDTEKQAQAFAAEFVDECPGNRTELHRPHATLTPTADSASHLGATALDTEL